MDTKQFPFGQYVDITEFAKAHNPMQYKDYEKIYFCVDTWDYWIARILKDTYNDERKGYEDAKGWWLVERNKIQKPSKAATIQMRRHLVSALNEDDLSNWDCENTQSLEQAIEMIDGGYGIQEDCPFPASTKKIQA